MNQYSETGFNSPTQTAGSRLTAFKAFLASVDWGLVFRVASRFVGFLGMAYLTYVLKIYFGFAGLGALGSIGQYITGLFFFYMLLITGKKYQEWNFLFLIGLFGVVITF